MSRHLPSEHISWWIAGERTLEAQRHVAECARCRAEVHRLQDAFSQFRDSGRRWSAHWYAAPAAPRRRTWFWRRPLFVGGLAVAVLVGVLLVRRLAPVTFVTSVTPVNPVSPVSNVEPFMAIPYVAPLAPYEHTTVMRMRVPVTALITAGFDVHAPEPGATVTVDVLVGQDGRAHAIRPVEEVKEVKEVKGA